MERHDPAVDLRADGLVANVGVHRVREVDWRRTRRQRLHLALGREDVHLVAEQVCTKCAHVLGGVVVVALPVHQRLDPGDPLVVAFRGAATLVEPVRRNPELGLLVHLTRSHLDLERCPVRADHGRVQRPIAVQLGHRDEILEPAGHRLPQRMDDPEGGVAIARSLFPTPLDQHPHGGEVVDLVELAALLGHLVVDRVEVLRPARNVGRDVGLREVILQIGGSQLDLGLAVGTPVRDHRLDLRELPGMEDLEREVLELPFDRMDSQAVRERRVDLERLLRLLHLLLLTEIFDRAHVVQPICELDQDHAHVLSHRNDHLPVVLGLGLLPALEADSRELRHPFDELHDVVAEGRSQLVDVRVGVFDHVVEQCGGDRLRVEVKLRADEGNTERMVDKRLARSPHLAPVGPQCLVVGAPDQLLVDTRVVGLDARDQLCDEVVLMPFCIDDCHSLSLLVLFRVTGSQANVPKHLGPCPGFVAISSAAASCGCLQSWIARLPGHHGGGSHRIGRRPQAACGRLSGAPCSRSSRNVGDSSS